MSKYIFTSVGKKRIDKAVEFTHTGIRNIVNLGFGDLLPDGSIDDKANSNNGDIVKVLTTITRIIVDFTMRFPYTEILFTGSTQERTRLYTRILNTYYKIFSKEFIITGIIKVDDHFEELTFKPGAELKYWDLLLKKSLNFSICLQQKSIV